MTYSPALAALPGLRIAAGCVLVVLWGAIGWGIVHRRRYARELSEEDAIPAAAPRALLKVVLSALVVGFSALMLYFLFSGTP